MADKAPDPPSPLTRAAWNALAQTLDGPPSPARLAAALRVLAKWRAQMLANTLRRRDGDVIGSGPFRGMVYEVAASEGGYVPRRLGAYEASLAPIIEEIVARNYATILDIGCAEGYYAVGLARRMPNARILAHDSDPRARALCAALARANGVAARVEIGADIDHRGLEARLPPGSLVLCDIEGAEDALLDPEKAPALARSDVLVEVHETFRPGLVADLTARFARSHEITRIDRALAPDTLPDWAETLSDLDRLLMLWEWRAGPTPWLWMKTRKTGA